MLIPILFAGLSFAACAGAAQAWFRRPRARAGQEVSSRLIRELMLENNPLGMAHIQENTFTWVNPSWARIFGLLPEHLEGASTLPFHMDSMAYENFNKEASFCLARGESYSTDIRLRRVDGTPFWGRLHGRRLAPAPSLLLGHPAPPGAIWCLEDVTQRIEAQEELSESLGLKQRLIAFSPTGILLYRAADGSCMVANEAASRLADAPMASLLQDGFRSMESWKGSGLLAAAEAALATGTDQRLETRLLSSSGRELWVDAHFVPFMSRGERLLLLMQVDISARIRADRELQESLERYRVVVDSLNEGLAIVDVDLRFSFVNNRLARMLGYEVSEILGQFQSFLLAEEDFGIMQERLRLREAGARDNYEIRMKKKSGEKLHVLLSVAPQEDAQGRPLPCPILVTDISERKRVEREREELLSELKQKNKELETLVYVASHDLRSPLVNIQGFSQRLRKALDELKRRVEGALDLPELAGLKGAILPLLQERMPAALDYIRASGVKMDAIINGLLHLSRAGRMVLRVETLDMDQLLHSCAASMAFQLQSVEGTFRMEELPACRADSAQIAQVFSNLLDNAIKYRDPEQSLRVRVSGRVQGESVLYSVEDNGLGIPEEQRERVWDIFQRLDPTGATPGEGLGLTLVRRMVERNGGRIWVEAAAKTGCLFQVELPAG